MIRNLILCVLLCIFFIPGKSQNVIAASTVPHVGEELPPFYFSDISYYSKKSAEKKDFLGKWLILDFWFPGCVNCIKSFPKLNKLQNEFRDNLTIVLVGQKDRSIGYKDTDKVFEKIKSRQNLNIVSAYDSAIFKRWPIGAMPHVIIVNPKGVVKAITANGEITFEKISKLISGDEVNFFPKDQDSGSFDSLEVIKKIDQTKPLISSFLKTWKGEQQSIPASIKSYVDYNKYLGFRACGIPLYGLYNYAYWGQWLWTFWDSMYPHYYPKPILELRDSSDFIVASDLRLGGNLYNYDLRIAYRTGNSELDIKQAMQNDLKRAFGFSVKTEIRSLPVWTLISLDSRSQKIISKGGKIAVKRDSSGGASGFEAKSCRLDEIMLWISQYYPLDGLPFINNSGIKGDELVDIKIDAMMTDANAMKRELNKYGLDIVKSFKEMNAIIIGEPVN